MINKLTERLNNISITKKMILLIAVMILGMFFVGSVARLRIFVIKHDFDILYNKRTLPIIELEEIKDIYTVNIYDTLLDVEKKIITPSEAEEITRQALELIHKRWSEYKKSLSIEESNIYKNFLNNFILDSICCDEEEKRKIESDLVEKIEKKAEIVDTMLKQIFLLLKANQRSIASEVMNKDLYPSINLARIYLTQLINFNLDCAIMGKTRTDEIYDTTLVWIILSMALIIFITSFTVYAIIQNIRKIHIFLEKAVEKKTRELRTLNENLKERIEKEVRKNREKDRIMFQQSRLAAMGEMIGNIAHQWRQPLNVLTLIIQSFNTKRMSGKLSDEFIEKQVEEGMKLSNAMSKTIEDFRNFFNPNREKENFSIKTAIENALFLMGGACKDENIDIKIICREDFIAYANANEFSQVILNLISNAKDALAQNKTEEKLIWITLAKKSLSQESAIIEIVDSGGGIDEKIIDRVFEPYFTTKHKSVGTGIGLYMSKQIIEGQMKGKITVQNKEFAFDKGKLFKCALFTIEIPVKKRVSGDE